jgi:hypothetical protein
MADFSRQEKELKQKSAAAVDKTTDPIEKLRLKCLSRGASGIKGLGRTFRNMDDDGSKSLDFDEFKKGLHDCGMSSSDAEAKAMFNTFDTDRSGTLSFDEFLKALRVSLAIYDVCTNNKRHCVPGLCKHPLFSSFNTHIHTGTL